MARCNRKPTLLSLARFMRISAVMLFCDSDLPDHQARIFDLISAKGVFMQ
jgi:hypothetical protein